MIARGAAALYAAAMAMAPADIPEKYDHPFPGVIYMMKATPDDTHTFCGSPAAIACTVGHTDKECWVVVNEKYYLASKYWHDFIIRHERAHCNGWPADHRAA